MALNLIENKRAKSMKNIILHYVMSYFVLNTIKYSQLNVLLNSQRIENLPDTFSTASIIEVKLPFVIVIRRSIRTLNDIFSPH